MRVLLSIVMIVGVTLISTGGFAFSIFKHPEITKKGLSLIVKDLNGPKKFTVKAMANIASANRLVDIDQKRAHLHFDNETFDLSSGRIVRLRDEVIAALKSSPPQAEKAQKLTGQALHTIQDFFSHTNWVEEEAIFNFAIPKFGKTKKLNVSVLTSTQQACGSNTGDLIIPLGKITSGYVSSTSGYCDPPPQTGPRKCRHGGSADQTVDGMSCPGIAKDSTDHPEHIYAKGFAEQATKQFVDGILGELVDNKAAICSYMGHPMSSCEDEECTYSIHQTAPGVGGYQRECIKVFPETNVRRAHVLNYFRNNTSGRQFIQETLLYSTLDFIPYNYKYLIKEKGGTTSQSIEYQESDDPRNAYQVQHSVGRCDSVRPGFVGILRKGGVVTWRPPKGSDGSLGCTTYETLEQWIDSYLPSDLLNLSHDCHQFWDHEDEDGEPIECKNLNE